ncbi:MAG: hypothetical protein J5780_02570 [Treponema sp.]|nr:hypothetical protein [Treponema sp.]
MKKLLGCIVAAAVILSACSKKEQVSQSVSGEPVRGETKQTVVVKPKGSIPSVMVAGGFWSLVESGDNAGKMQWVEYTVPGTVVYAFPSISADSEINYEVKKAVRLTDNKEREFIHITYDDNDYWAQDYSIAVNAVPGVIVGKTAWLYKKDTPADILEKSISAGTIVGVSRDPADDSNPFSTHFKKIRTYVNDSLIEKQFVSADDVSTASDDLIGIQLYNKLSAKDKNGEYVLSDEVAREELFETVLNLSTSSTIFELLKSIN